MTDSEAIVKCVRKNSSLCAAPPYQTNHLMTGRPDTPRMNMCANEAYETNHLRRAGPTPPRMNMSEYRLRNESSTTGPARHPRE